MAVPARHADGVLLAWRNFTFFDSHTSSASEVLSSATDVAFVSPAAAAWASPRGALVLAHADGRLTVVDARTAVVLASWPAFHAHPTRVQIASELGAIVAVGQDDDTLTPQLRIWRLERRAEVWTPVLVGHARFVHGVRASDGAGGSSMHAHRVVSTLEVHNALALVAVGFTDGSVFLLRDVGEAVAHPPEHGAVLRSRMVRDAVVTEEGQDGVTGLAFVLSSEERRRGVHVHLLIATVSQTLRCIVPGTGGGATLVVIDSIGCKPQCATSFLACTEAVWNGTAPPDTPLSPKLVLARDEALYVIGVDGREASIALESPKVCIRRLYGQLVILSVAPIGQRVTIFDFDTKCITYTAGYSHGVCLLWTTDDAVMPEPLERVAVVTNVECISLEDKPLQTKLEQLMRMHLYVQAVPFVLARAARFPGAPLPQLVPSAVIMPSRPRDRTVAPHAMLVADIYRRYGDHLYAKGDFPGAILQFVKTIGIVSPSYVIRKFLDAQRLQYLTAYLEPLHTRGLAHPDHTTLLLNCYTKLRDTSALERFLRAPPTAAHDSSPLFDVGVAIDVCRRAGCIEQAIYLAETYHDHAAYLSIQLRDAHDPDAALTYLAHLPPFDAAHFFQQYAHVLLDARAEATTELLTRVYSRSGASPAPALAHFVGHEASLATFLESLALARWGVHVGEEKDALEEDAMAMLGSELGADAYDAMDDARLIFDTLLELYLERAPRKALYMLRRPDMYPYTTSQALALCASAHFADGLLCVYERLGLVDAIVQHWMDASKGGLDERASAAALAALERHGAAAPRLYVAALQYLSSSSTLLERHRIDFGRVLAYIDTHALLSPIEVVQLVGRDGVVPMGMLSDYLLRHVRNERAELLGIEKLVTSYRAETRAKAAELAELESATTPRVFQNPRCGVCDAALELPAVHFMCKHSFHLRCLPDGEAGRECPLCAQAHETAQALQQDAQLSLDIVLDEVHAADDGFDVIADMFARGIVV